MPYPSLHFRSFDTEIKERSLVTEFRNITANHLGIQVKTVSQPSISTSQLPQLRARPNPMRVICIN